MHDTSSIGSRSIGSRSWRAARVIAFAALLLAALAVPLAPAAPAHASTHGAGDYVGSHWHGNYMENGAYVYCLDYHLDWDGGASPTWAGTVTSYGSLPPGRLAGIGAAVAAIGQTGDPFEARAIADAIWHITDGIVPSGPTAARAMEVVRWIDAWVAAPDAGTVAMSIVSTGPADGVLTIDSIAPGAPVAGTIVLTGGVFVDTGVETMTGTFTAGQSIPIRGLPTTGAPYRIAATLTGTSTLSTFGAAVPVYSYGPGQQGMAGPAPLAIIPVTGSASEADERAAVVLSTRTTATVPAGTGIRDTAIVGDHGVGVDLAGWTIGFELYEFPAAGGAAPVCAAETLVFSSAEIPIDGAGEFESDAYLSMRPGTYGWIATLYDPAHVPQAVGVCGEPSETVRVEPVLAITGDASAAVGVVLAGGLALGGAGFAAAAANERRRRR